MDVYTGGGTAIRVAERLGPAARVVTLMADSGLKYLNTDAFRKG